MTPDQIDREEDRRVKEMAEAASAQKAKVRISSQKLRYGRPGSKRRAYLDSGVSLGMKRLGYSSMAAYGDAVRKEIVDREERMAQHGPVRVLWKDGKPVA